jgi:hypothetical protein
LRPAGVVVKMAHHKGNVDIAAFPNGFPVVDCFKNR